MGRTAKKEKPLFAKNLMAIRKKKGFKSGEQFAKHAGIPWSTYRQYEAGVSEGTPTNRQFLADKLGVSISDLYWSGDRENLIPKEVVKTLVLAANSLAKSDPRPEVVSLLGVVPDLRDDQLKQVLDLAVRLAGFNKPKSLANPKGS